MLEYKAATVEGNVKGIEFLFKKNKVDWLKGWGKVTAPGEVTVEGTAHRAKHIVIATGSEPAQLAGRRGRREDRRHLDRRARAPRDPEAAGGDRRRRHRPRARLGLRPARLGGHRRRVPRPDHPGHGPRGLQDPAAPARQAGPDLRARRRRRGRREGRQRHHRPLQAPQGRQRRHRDRRRRAGRDRPPPVHQGRRPRGGRRRADRARPGEDRQALADQHPRHLRHRRRRRRPDAGAQGRGRGHGGRRDHRRPARPRELRGDPRASSTPPPRSRASARPRRA